MAATNVQAFSGDVEITSNLAVNTDVLFVNSIGNRVGIGTTEPDKKLHIYTTAGEGNTQLYLESESRYSTIQMLDDTGAILFGNDRGDFRFITGHDTSISGGSEAMRITGNGNVGIGTNDPTATLDIYKEDTTAAGQTVISSITGVFSGSDATGGNVNNKGLFINLDSSATGGTLTVGEEHRLWGIDVDIDVTGDSDDIKGGKFLVRSELAENVSDRNTNIYGIDAQAQHNGSAPSTNIIGVFGRSLKASSSTGLTTRMIGVDTEYEIDAGTCTDAYGMRARFDRSGGGAVSNSYIFYGDHIGSTTTITNNYGLYVTDVDKHYLEGNVGIGKTEPGAKLDVSGTIRGTQVLVGTGGDLGLTINDGGGNANLTFNHANRTPDQDGSSARITSGVDGNTGDLTFSVKDNVTAGTVIDMVNTMRMRETYVQALADFYVDGDVGIGTTEPVGVNGGRRLEGSSTTGFEYIATRDDTTVNDGNFIGGYLFKNADAAGTAPHFAGMTAYAAGASGQMDLRFFGGRETYEDTPLAPHMTITKSGSVGIGLTNPKTTLSVAGNFMSQGTGSTIFSHNLYYSGGWKYASTGDGGAYMRVDNSQIEFWNAPNGGTEDAAASVYQRMTITESGTIGIANSDPTTYLDFGNIITNRIISLYGGGSTTSTNYYGFGINPNTLRYNVDATTAVHKFYGGATEYGYVDDGTGFVNSFTGQHKSFPHESLTGKTADELSGLIVCASGDHISVNDDIPQRGQDGIMVSEAIPTVCLSSQMNDKTVFGVVSNVEDPESTQREDRNGAFTSTFKKIVGDTRIYVNSIGEGAVWVVNTNGSFVNGDYITTSNVVGYGQKQDSDTLKNYTVAKITMDCDFAGTLIPKKRIKKKTVTETIEEIVEEEYESNMPEEIYTYDADRDCYMKTIKDNIKTNSRPVKQEYELRDSDGNIITEVVSNTITVEEYEALENKDGYVANITEGTEITENYTRIVNTPVKYTGDKVVVKTVTHEVDDLDEHGNLQWEDHPTETETPYKIRYLDANGVETDEANAVHKAVFVGCTYHCG